MACAHDQNVRVTPAGSGTSCTTGSFTPPGGTENFLVAISTIDSSSDTLDISDSQSGSWTQLGATNTFNDGVMGATNKCWYRSNPGNSSMTVTATRGSSGGMGLIVFSFTGAGTPINLTVTESSSGVMHGTVDTGTGGFRVGAGAALSFTDPTELSGVTDIGPDTGAFSTQFWYCRTTNNEAGSADFGYSAPSNRHAGVLCAVPDASVSVSAPHFMAAISGGMRSAEAASPMRKVVAVPSGQGGSRR